MLHLLQITNSVNKRTAILSGLMFAAVIASQPISAWAQCKSWDAGREMLIVQPGFQSKLTIEQRGSVITGKAVGSVPEGVGNRRKITTGGTVDGTLDGNNFSIRIYWYNDHTGVYNGKVLPSGRLDGEGYEKRSPNIRVPWHSDGVLKCAPKPVAFGSPLFQAPPFSQSKPTKSSVKTKPAPTPPPPFIIAGQPVIPPYMSYGTVYLGWEGGPDHPNVEVWLSMDNGAEIPAFSMEHVSQSPVWKQPKVASIPLKLQRYHHYKFVLKAAGKTLSTAAFVVP